MSQPLPEEWFVRDARINAAVAWVLTAALVVTAVASFASGLFAATAFALVAAFVAVAPAAVARSWTRTVPWPLLALAAVPVLFGAARPSFLHDVVTGLSVAALAMLLAAALQLTTTVRMTPGFAVVFTVVATLATAGFWAVGSAASAVYFGTAFVETNDQLMWIFTAAALAGVVAGFLFRWYFRRRLAVDDERGDGEVGVA